MMYDVCSLGEILIDFLPAGVSDTGMRLYEQNPGGAPANVVCALSRLGMKTAFIGKVGCDLAGEFLTKTLQQAGVDTRGLIHDPNIFTTLAFVELSESGERSFSFARKPGADTKLMPRELDMELLRNSRVLHVGSLSLTDEPARSSMLKAIEISKQAGAIISYDPNYRAPLWENPKIAAERMRSILHLVDIIKISCEEAELLSGFSQPEAAGKELLKSGASCVVITLGEQGAAIFTRNGTADVAGFPSRVVDTTGAGDSFLGGFLYSLIQSGKSLEQLNLKNIKEFARFANAVASLCVEKRGAIPALPNIEQVMRRILKNK